MGIFHARHSGSGELNKMMFALKFIVGGGYSMSYTSVYGPGTGLGSAKRQVSIKSYKIHRKI